MTRSGPRRRRNREHDCRTDHGEGSVSTDILLGLQAELTSHAELGHRPPRWIGCWSATRSKPLVSDVVWACLHFDSVDADFNDLLNRRDCPYPELLGRRGRRSHRFRGLARSFRFRPSMRGHRTLAECQRGESPPRAGPFCTTRCNARSLGVPWKRQFFHRDGGVQALNARHRLRTLSCSRW